MNSTLQIKVMSSLEKCFPDEDLSRHAERTYFPMFSNERLALQIGVYRPRTDTDSHRQPFVRVDVIGALAKHVRVRIAETVASTYPTLPTSRDADYLRTTPSLYPDVLRPLPYPNQFRLTAGITQSLWLDIKLPDGVPAGEYPLEVNLIDARTEVCYGSAKWTVRVLHAQLPRQRLIHTEWFYTDCIAEAHHARPFSERHWKCIENYLRVAAENGINMILTPVFTPELDTYVGGYRLTTQLVSITVNEKNEYAFDFSLLDRWIALCRRVGIEYFEIPHFFTQWGARSAPKIVARMQKSGKSKRIFGWDTDAFGDEYKVFLKAFIPALLSCLKRNGVDKNVFFHISDEPHLEHLEHYKKCRELIEDCLGGDYPIIDALSDFAFYQSGAIKKPVPHVKRIGEFLDAGIDGLWAYYCGHSDGYAGRLLALPAYRTRILGVQLWRSRIEGFLHWGYNFFHTQYSYHYVDPFADSHCSYFAPSGDAFLVYPHYDGTALESIRLNAMREAMDDVRALDLLEELCGRAYVEALLRELTQGAEITFSDYPHTGEFLLALRDRLATEIEDRLLADKTEK